MAALNTDKFKKLSRRWVGQVGSGGVVDGVIDTIPLSSVTNLPTDTAVVAVIDRVDANGAPTTGNIEETVIGVVSGSNLINCIRGVEGNATGHDAGRVVEILVTAKGWNDLIDGILVEHNQDGTHKSITSTNASFTNLTASTIGSPSATVPMGVTTGTYQPPQSYSPAAAGTSTLNLALGNDHNVIFPAGNISLAISNGAIGQKFLVSLTQDSVGSRTVTWFSTIKWSGGSAPTLTATANKRDQFGFKVTGVGTYDGFIVGLNI